MQGIFLLFKNAFNIDQYVFELVAGSANPLDKLIKLINGSSDNFNIFSLLIPNSFFVRRRTENRQIKFNKNYLMVTI